MISNLCQSTENPKFVSNGSYEEGCVRITDKCFLKTLAVIKHISSNGRMINE
jgi:hypothetical protein